MSLSLVSGEASEPLPEFVDYLYGGLEGYVCGATKRVVEKDGKPDVEFQRVAFAWPARRDDMLDWIKTQSPTHDVYLAPAVFNGTSGQRQDFKATNVLWTEFDGNTPTEDSLGTVPVPTLRVQSSGKDNQHWYWRLDTPVHEVDKVESLNRALTYQLGGDPSAWDAVQLLRPPGTRNHKRDTETALLYRSEAHVTPNHFDVLPPVEAVSVDVPEAIPDVTEVVLKYAWPAEAAALYRSPRPKVGEADRSGMLMRLGYFLAEMGLSDGEMFSVLRNADDRWGKFKDRNDRDKQLASIISVSRRKYPAEVHIPDDAVSVYGLQSFLNTTVEIEWVIEGLLQTLGYMLLTGPAGVGKTQFSLRWAINLALGRSFLGLKVVEPQRILFFSLEMGHADLKFFLSTMCQGMTDEELMLLEQNLLILPLGEALYMDQPEQQQLVEDLLKEFKPSGIFIDSVGSSSSGNVSDESTVKALMDFNDKIRQRYNVFTWFIHHNRKAQGDNKKPNRLADVYGNQYLVNRATSVYCLWPAGGAIEVIPLKKRLAAMEDPWHINRLSNLDFLKKQDSVTLKAKSIVDLTAEDGFSAQPFGQSISDL